MRTPPRQTGASGQAGQPQRRIGQVPNPLALAYLLAHSPLFEKKAVFVLVPDEADRHAVAVGLNAFTANPPPIVEWTGAFWQLAEIAHRPFARGFLLADQMTLEQPLPGVQAFRRACLRLTVGEELPPKTLKHFLAVSGYEPETTANAPGRFAARGEVVDINDGRPEPLRVAYDGNRIERLERFDLASGKPVATTDDLLLAPLHLGGRSALVDHLASWPGLEAVVYEPEAEPALGLATTTVGVLPEAGGDNAGLQETKAYHLRQAVLTADATAATRVVVFTDQPKKVAGLLQSEGATVGAEMIAEPLAGRGFVDPATGLLALTDQAIGLGEDRKSRQSKRVKQAMIQSLKPGDYVVHLYHGIARFRGMSVMHVNDLDREYFVLEYAGNDKIYVPVELSDRIDKYVGEEHPRLHGLADASWTEAVSRVRAQTLELARGLLDLYARRTVARAPQFPAHPEESELQRRCPFTLTDDQTQALADIFADLAQDQPMDRLLCGDVGFGKTEVALRAAYRAVLSGYQVAVLAPTTVLAQQHFDTFQSRLEGFGVHVGMLSRMRTSKQQAATAAAISAGRADIVVGTHRLLSRDIHFKRLGLIILDEEQRFGVAAKEALKRLRTTAHVLSMTATPIPRTLHLSLSGVRQISTILTPPKLRRAVKTVIQPLSSATIQEAVETELARGGQTYYIYNRVQSIERRRRELQALLPTARISIAHGQMNPEELAGVMHRFDIGEVDLLLATTIVENGLDIPNANTLIVENASQFGLSELYQLKGRVGRSDRQGYAYFLYTEQVPDADAKKRFLALQEAEALGSGFELAMKDMEIRGVGNMLGKEQHGHAIRIGLHLYVRLLNQAVREMEGAETELERDIPVDLPLEARLPEEFLPNEADRIQLYQGLATIRDRFELLERRNQYEATGQFGRPGQLHPAVSGLFDLLEIRLLAGHSPLLAIDTTYPNAQNQLASPRLTLTSQQPFAHLPLEWERLPQRRDSAYKARASLAELGSDWPKKLKYLIGTLGSGAQDVNKGKADQAMRDSGSSHGA
jgi:transcription-repair coupling factor (superfamily II helicase)